MEPQSGSNDDQTRCQAQYWNGSKAGHWLIQEHCDERMLAPFTRLVLGAAAMAHTVVSSMSAAAPDQQRAWRPPTRMTARHSAWIFNQPRAAVLDAAGLGDVAIEPVAEPLWLGRDVLEALCRPRLDLTNHGQVPTPNRSTR
jgi:hypothetical protein